MSATVPNDCDAQGESPEEVSVISAVDGEVHLRDLQRVDGALPPDALVLSLQDCPKLALLTSDFLRSAPLEQLFLANLPRLTSVPRHWDRAVHTLRILDIYRVPLRTWPVSGDWSRLQQLRIRETDLTEFPNKEETWLSPVLERVEIAQNPFLQDIHDTFFAGCPRMVRLDLTRNRLLQLPATIGDCARLEFIDISHNPIERLPDSIGRLPSLRELRACYLPHLQQLPEDLGHSCESLETLAVQQSGIERIPGSLEKLTRLQDLRLDGCPLHAHRTDLYGRTSALSRPDATAACPAGAAAAEWATQLAEKVRKIGEQE